LSLPIAAYAPFFSLRVDTSRDGYALHSALGAMLPLPDRSLGARVWRVMARKLAKFGSPRRAAFLRTFCNFCRDCSSLTLSHDYAYEDLVPLYADYRSSTYNNDRISVEPGYASIADRVGRDSIERTSRNNGVAAFLTPFMPSLRNSLALDLGGSDGKFIPPQVIDHYEQTHIFDTSDAEVDPGVLSSSVRKIRSNPEEASYALLMCMHVLEHVGNPRAFVMDSLKYLQPGGLLYLEVPLELDPSIESQFTTRNIDRCVTIHEHINQYSPDSVCRLIESIRTLKLVKSETADIDCGWSTGRVGRYLAQHVD
jgi:hypothetical protein